MATADPPDPYAAIASIYDDWHEELGLQWVGRFEAQLGQFGSPREDLAVLDLGCGTGTFLVALRALHPAWKLVGLDASASMLAVARGKPRAGTVEWHRASIETAPRLGTFDVVVSFFDALNHLVTDGGLARALRAASDALVPGGLLMFDLNNRRGCEERSLRSSTASRFGWEISASSFFDAGVGLETTSLVVRLGQGPPLETTIVRRCFKPEDVTGELEAAGFTVELEDTWSFVRGQIAGKTWYVARKRPS